jgi:hypothetical protein
MCQFSISADPNDSMFTPAITDYKLLAGYRYYIQASIHDIWMDNEKFRQCFYLYTCTIIWLVEKGTWNLQEAELVSYFERQPFLYTYTLLGRIEIDREFTNRRSSAKIVSSVKLRFQLAKQGNFWCSTFKSTF